jgi:hypothetical protein
MALSDRSPPQPGLGPCKLLFARVGIRQDEADLTAERRAVSLHTQMAEFVDEHKIHQGRRQCVHPMAASCLISGCSVVSYSG